jgi:hypothetical protein
LRDAWSKFVEHDIRLYAVSYDDVETLAEFSREQNIPFPLLSDIDSEVIRRYGILNTEVSRDDAVLFGIPFPGVYISDESGRVVAKFFHDTYKKRDSAENLIDAALGRILLDDSAPSVRAVDDEAVRISASMHGGKGSIRQGVMRKLVVRFELAEGLHIYGEPVPTGMVATSVSVTGPEGFVTREAVKPPTETLHLAALDIDLNVWSGTVDIVIPCYARGELASETRPLDQDSIDIEIEVHYQACTDQECLLPRTEKLTLGLPMDVVDVPRLGVHMGHGQREGSYSSAPAMRRLVLRKARENPIGLLKFLWKNSRMELAARWRGRRKP